MSAVHLLLFTRFQVSAKELRWNPDNYISDSIPASKPTKITEGEFEIVVEHDVAKNLLTRVEINGKDVTGHVSLQDRIQRLSRGRFGMRTAIHNTTPQVSLCVFRLLQLGGAPQRRK